MKKSTETDSRCFEILLNILEDKLPYGIRESLLSQIRKDITKKANTCREVVPLIHSVQPVPSEQLQRESTAVHTQLLGRLEDSIRQHERACTEKNLLEQRLKAKSEKHEKLKHELETLKSQNNEISASLRDDMDRAQSRISACESVIMTLKTRIKELEKTIEEQGMQARRGRDTATMRTKNLFTQFAHNSQQEIERAVRMKEKELKLEIHEREVRIRELEAKSKPNIDVNPPDRLIPDHLQDLSQSLRPPKGKYDDAGMLALNQDLLSSWDMATVHVHDDVLTSKWRDLGTALGFSEKELENILVEQPLVQQDHLHLLLRQWLHWYPGDERGSTSFATYTQLKTALINAGLGAVARDLPSYERIAQERLTL